MVGIEHIWGAVCGSFGVCFGAACVVTSNLVEEWLKERKRKHERLHQKASQVCERI